MYNESAHRKIVTSQILDMPLGEKIIDYVKVKYPRHSDEIPILHGIQIILDSDYWLMDCPVAKFLGIDSNNAISASFVASIIDQRDRHDRGEVIASPFVSKDLQIVIHTEYEISKFIDFFLFKVDQLILNHIEGSLKEELFEFACDVEAYLELPNGASGRNLRKLTCHYNGKIREKITKHKRNRI